jgi:hypothetical protein
MSMARSDLAAAILKAAADGERNPERLREIARGDREIVVQVA